jgi:hypothetical protein
VLLQVRVEIPEARGDLGKGDAEWLHGASLSLTARRRGRRAVLG